MTTRFFTACFALAVFLGLAAPAIASAPAPRPAAAAVLKALTTEASITPVVNTFSATPTLTPRVRAKHIEPPIPKPKAATNKFCVWSGTWSHLHVGVPHTSALNCPGGGYHQVALQSRLLRRPVSLKTGWVVASKGNRVPYKGYMTMGPGDDVIFSKGIALAPNDRYGIFLGNDHYYVVETKVNINGLPYIHHSPLFRV